MIKVCIAAALAFAALSNGAAAQSSFKSGAADQMEKAAKFMFKTLAHCVQTT